MKFKQLKKEFEILMNNDEVAALDALETLKNGLLEKKAKFVHKLKKGVDPMTRDKVEAKLKESQVMLKKVKASLAERQPTT